MIGAAILALALCHQVTATEFAKEAGVAIFAGSGVLPSSFVMREYEAPNTVAALFLKETLIADSANHKDHVPLSGRWELKNRNVAHWRYEIFRKAKRPILSDHRPEKGMLAGDLQFFNELLAPFFDVQVFPNGDHYMGEDGPKGGRFAYILGGHVDLYYEAVPRNTPAPDGNVQNKPRAVLSEVSLLGGVSTSDGGESGLGGSVGRFVAEVDGNPDADQARKPKRQADEGIARYLFRVVRRAPLLAQVGLSLIYGAIAYGAIALGTSTAFKPERPRGKRALIWLGFGLLVVGPACLIIGAAPNT